MSESTSSIVRFPSQAPPANEPSVEVEHARERIKSLPDAYITHAAPSKEHLVGVAQPVSPAADAANTNASTAPTIPATAVEKAPALAITNANPANAPVINPLSSTAAAEPVNEKPERPAVQPENPPAKKRSLPSQFLPLITGVAVFALLSLLFEAPIFLNQIKYLTHPKAAVAPTTADQTSTEVPPAPTISIPKISVNAPVVYATSNDENAILTDLETGVVHYADTALPGQVGNSVIFGHSSNDWWEPGNYKFVFVLLDKISPGDTFTVNYQSHAYIYQVTSSEVVDPTDVAVLNPTSDAEMTLITCSPPGTSWKRLIVHSKLISPASGTKAAATTKATSTSLPSNSPGVTQTIGNWWSSIVSLFSGKHSTPEPTTTTSTSGAAPTSIPATQ
jgi:LPXTG-site transpeptidase (sortase) family protein